MSDTTPSPWSEEARQANIDRVNAEFAEKGGGQLTIENSVEYWEGSKIQLPLNPKMGYAEGSQFLAKLAEDMEEMYEYTENFMCRPADGALAFNKVLKDGYQIGAIGKAIQGWGGTQLPVLKTVEVEPPRWSKDHTKVIRRAQSVQVPWGLMDFPPLKAQFQMYARPAKDYGPAFSVRVIAKKLMAPAIMGVFEAVKEYLEEHSIYRNKALEGLGTDIDPDGFWAPSFLDAYALDRTQIVYASYVYRALHHNVWGRIKAYDQLQQKGKRFRPQVLLQGEPGTGKSAAELITAQMCLEHGMGYIQAGGDEDLSTVINFAANIGHPMMVGVEDAEKLVPDADDPRKLSDLLNLLDGLQNKGREVGLIMTTNHPEKFPSGMIRSRRLRVIYVSDLDPEALRQLIDIRIPASQREELDYDVLGDTFSGFKPASVVEVLEDAEVASIIRTGELDAPLATEDFVMEADTLRPQLDLLARAMEREKEAPLPLESALRGLVREEVSDEFSNRIVDLSDGEIMVRD